MKHLIFLITIFILSTPTWASEKEQCANTVRAPNKDQIDMTVLVAVAPKALALPAKDIFSLKIDNYVSWKGEQSPKTPCLADVIHRADITVDSISQGQICTTHLTLHRKDHFADGSSYSEFKIRNQVSACAAPNEQQSAALNQCAVAHCDYIGNEQSYPDHLDGCRCKLISDTVQITDQTGKYEGFFDPSVSFKKPEGIDSPFTP